MTKKDPFLQVETFTKEQESVAKAINEYCKRQRKKEEGPKRRNKSPEEDVVKILMEWYRDRGFFIRRFESKAKQIGGIWRSGGISYGTPDLGGVCPKGFAHWCEVKAPGRRSTLRADQRDFLIKIIDHNGFAICCDSVEYLERVYNAWLPLDQEERVLFLKAELPK